VINALFGKPKAILAPDPAKQKEDGATLFDYVRPLATIEPTAIAFGMPVNAQVGLDDTAGLKAELDKDVYRDALVLVGWEHKIINEIECQIITGNGCVFEKDENGVKKSGDVVKWDGDDFDRIDIVKINWSARKATIEMRSQGLDGQPKTCPQ
jgi:hypothetical protein